MALSNAPRSSPGFTRLELFLIVAVVYIVLTLIYVLPHDGLQHSNMLQAVENGQELQKAWLAASLEQEATGSKKVGWPADIDPSPSDIVSTYQLLHREDYLPSPKILAARGITAAPDFQHLTKDNIAFSLAMLSKTSSDSLPFLWTKNFDPISRALDSDTKPFGSQGFVVVRKAGDGSYYRNAGDANNRLDKNNFVWGQDLCAVLPPIKILQPSPFKGIREPPTNPVRQYFYQEGILRNDRICFYFLLFASSIIFVVTKRRSPISDKKKLESDTAGQQNDPQALNESTRRNYLPQEKAIQCIGSFYFLSGSLKIIFCVIGVLSLFIQKPGDSSIQLYPEAWGALLLFFTLGLIQLWLSPQLRQLNPRCIIPATIISCLTLFIVPGGTIVSLYVLHLFHGKKGRFIFSEPYRLVMSTTPEVICLRSYNVSTVDNLWIGFLLFVSWSSFLTMFSW